MIFESTQFFMIEAHGGKYKKNTLNSLYTTFKSFKNSDLSIIKEKKSREETLNLILKKRNINKDIFIFVDDIIFLDGWHRSLNKNAKDGMIVGFSMLKEGGRYIQDFGYDLIKLDGVLSSYGLYKGELLGKKKLPSYRKCSAVCGCAMWISKKVLDKVENFPLEGNNRWGEMIFSNLARRKGFKTIVLSSHLIHYGSSTKLKKDPLLSSNSWLVEKDMWNEISLKFFHDALIVKKINSKFSIDFIKLIKNSKKLLIYGCGTISDLVTKKYKLEKKTDYASSLPEEIGQKFYNKKVKNINRINFSIYDKIFISSVGYEKKVITLIPKDFRQKIICVQKSIKQNYIDYSLCKYESFLTIKNNFNNSK